MTDAPKRRGSLAGFLFSTEGWPYLLVPFIPAAVILEIAHANPTMIFFIAAAGIIPTAAVMGRATEELAAKAGPGIGGLLNVTFGNAPELIIALFALNAGLHEVVKASIIGSIMGNVLLVMGAAFIAGGVGRGGQIQRFDKTAANVQSTMLLLAAAALLMPAVFELIDGGNLPAVGTERVNYPSNIETISVVVGAILVLTYVAGLFFSLKTHKDVFNPVADASEGDDHEGLWDWSVRKSVIWLFVAGVAVGLMSEILVGAIGEASESVGLSEFFIGVIVVAIVGNAAEHWVAVLVAFKGKMNLAVNIAIGSSAQIALFVAPVLVFCSFFIGPEPMALVFNGYELGAILLTILIAGQVTQEGESTWFEGVQLLAMYVILAVVFAFA